MSATELELANRHTVAAFQFAANPASVRGAVQCSTACNLFATFMSALLPPTVLDAKLGRRLRTLVAAFHRAASTATMPRAQTRTTDGRLATPLVRAPLATPVSCAKELITGTLVASRKGAASPTAVRNAKARRALSALGAAFTFAESVATVLSTVEAASDHWIVASVNAADSGTRRSHCGGFKKIIRRRGLGTCWRWYEIRMGNACRWEGISRSRWRRANG